MRTETEIRHEGMNILVEKLGMIDAERFIVLISRERFDYTKWKRENLWKEKSIEEIFEISKERYNHFIDYI